LGVTLALPARRLFFARIGGGAFRRDDGRERRDLPLRVSQVVNLEHALLTTGFPYHRAEHEDNNLLEFAFFLARAQGIRTMGASALDLVNVASGALSGYWEGWLQPWDAAPGALIVREAGGQVTDYQGNDWTIFGKTLVASNGQPALHTALLDGVREARRGLRTRLLPGDPD
jgi:myo-inositol-1(or 4)-monophosphatase